MSIKSRLHLVIHGNVQGVFYRASAKKEAEKLSLTGWLQNTPQKTVEMVLEGDREDLEKFLSWCYDGPDLAKVDNIDVMWEDFTGDFDSIEIK